MLKLFALFALVAVTFAMDPCAANFRDSGSCAVFRPVTSTDPNTFPMTPTEKADLFQDASFLRLSQAGLSRSEFDQLTRTRAEVVAAVTAHWRQMSDETHFGATADRTCRAQYNVLSNDTATVGSFENQYTKDIYWRFDQPAGGGGSGAEQCFGSEINSLERATCLLAFLTRPLSQLAIFQTTNHEVRIHPGCDNVALVEFEYRWWFADEGEPDAWDNGVQRWVLEREDFCSPWKATFVQAMARMAPEFQPFITSEEEAGFGGIWLGDYPAPTEPCTAIFAGAPFQLCDICENPLDITVTQFGVTFNDPCLLASSNTCDRCLNFRLGRGFEIAVGASNPTVVFTNIGDASDQLQVGDGSSSNDASFTWNTAGGANSFSITLSEGSTSGTFDLEATIGGSTATFTGLTADDQLAALELNVKVSDNTKSIAVRDVFVAGQVIDANIKFIVPTTETDFSLNPPGPAEFTEKSPILVGLPRLNSALFAQGSVEITGNIFAEGSFSSGDTSSVSVAFRKQPFCTRLVVVDADTELAIATVVNGAILSKADFPGVNNFAVYLLTVPAGASSARIQTTGAITKTQNENHLPFSSFGDFVPNFSGRSFSVGTFNFEYTVYDATGQSGNVLLNDVVTIEVVA